MSNVNPIPLDTRLPRYQQLRDLFVQAIAEGRWRPGEAIPAEDELAARHEVAVGTVRKAIEGLVAEGRLERHQGRGTYVRRGAFGDMLARFFRMVDPSGAPIRPTSLILARVVDRADEEVAARLAIQPGAPVIRHHRARLVDGAPILAERIYLPRAPFANLLSLPTDQYGDLLYPLYERVCGRVVASARETIRFGAAPLDMAAALGAEPGLPAVVVDRVAFGFDDAPLEFRRSYGPAEKFSYSIDLR